MKQPLQLNKHRIQALLNGASMLIMPIELPRGYSTTGNIYDNLLEIYPSDYPMYIYGLKLPLQIGQTYFVQEEFIEEGDAIYYKLTHKTNEFGDSWEPASQMQEHQSRIPSLIPLEIEGKRVHDISEEELLLIIGGKAKALAIMAKFSYEDWLGKQKINHKENPCVFTIKVKTETRQLKMQQCKDLYIRSTNVST
ncbi:hypothetical protein [Sulfurimonas sp.]|uniref:hypothetical protein n=1 Tax=Sulfurimonas sp. TaxID=2022749 RepID=UPI003D0E1F61